MTMTMPMTMPTRLHPYIDAVDMDMDFAPDDELPVYDATTSTPPPYTASALDEPLATYHLRQYDRKIQMLFAKGARTASYRITTNSFRVFSKRPDMEVLYTSPQMRQRTIAAIRFDNDGGFPWRPRAHFDHVAEDGAASSRYAMESRNFRDWSVALGDAIYVWRLDGQPTSLVLCEENASAVVARFTYSEKGVLAQRGGDVGELVVYADAVTTGRDGVAKVVCGLMVVISFLKRSGRNYTNGRERGGSLGTEIRAPALLHRGSEAGCSSVAV
jgi:hypothetical protein